MFAARGSAPDVSFAKLFFSQRKAEADKEETYLADISISGLNKYFGENQILYDITFDIFPGEKVAIVGPNGAGKTTLFRVLTGELPYESGTISIAKDRTVGMIDQIPVYEPGDTV